MPEIIKKTDSQLELINGDIFMNVSMSSEYQYVEVLPFSSFQSFVASDRQAIETSDRNNKIFSFIAENKKATSAQIARHMGLSQARTRAILKELTDNGLITKVSDKRFAHYILNIND